jgi:hypothetical protein
MNTCASRFAFALAIAAGLAPPALAEDVWIQNGFGTGRDFMNMTEIERRAYAMGVVNGVTLPPLFGATQQQLAWFDACTDTMSDRQVARIIFEYLADNPQSWAEQLHVLTISALRQAYDASTAVSGPGF